MEDEWGFPADGRIPVLLPAGADPTQPPPLCRVCSKFWMLKEAREELELVKNNDFTVEPTIN